MRDVCHIVFTRKIKITDARPAGLGPQNAHAVRTVFNGRFKAHFRMLFPLKILIVSQFGGSV
jgi:hypothetical protein